MLIYVCNVCTYERYISGNNNLDSPYCRARSLIVAELAFSSAPFLFTKAFTSGQSHYREAPFSFASATIFFLSLAARGPSFHSSPVCWWPRWPRRGPEMNITFAAIRPSFALRLAPSLTRGPLASFSSSSFFSSATTNLFLIFSRRDRKKRSPGRSVSEAPGYVPRG